MTREEFIEECKKLIDFIESSPVDLRITYDGADLECDDFFISYYGALIGEWDRVHGL